MNKQLLKQKMRKKLLLQNFLLQLNKMNVNKQQQQDLYKMKMQVTQYKQVLQNKTIQKIQIIWIYNKPYFTKKQCKNKKEQHIQQMNNNFQINNQMRKVQSYKILVLEVLTKISCHKQFNIKIIIYVAK
ncbi:hypothetical protein IMG5_130340 [Ichthyophthirius multifiliis]|uniref:Uncharacterized protein n=1 Tax=Ichthyophthirius multifiliis TaxID=5932 RepID=G0QW97_ICHMU|nr:hypothetical protein IMG5_130340 [Ichthyophthirius multifiliis]EGR30520.1 hypothetical protein IMG5_130340 [Ichthyophthirius multifiliis]|eukprot:XP_004032107.1 hypothetical protein IMG5_130340 [Ichthyophthirius multifiliis]